MDLFVLTDMSNLTLLLLFNTSTLVSLLDMFQFITRSANHQWWHHHSNLLMHSNQRV